jgi:plasmid segregation protein ParM
MNKNQVIAIDCGFGDTKIKSIDYQLSIPSMVAEFHPNSFVTNMESNLIENLVIKSNGKAYFVGKSASKFGKVLSTIDKDRTVSEEGINLLLGGLSLVLQDQPSAMINLVVGLPVQHYEGLKDSYLNAIQKLHSLEILGLNGQTLDRKYLSIQEAKVVPQPFGSLMDQILDDNGQLIDKKLAAGKVGIIDIGWNTADLAVFNQLEFISKNSTSFSGMGVFSMFQFLSGELYKALDIEIPPEMLNETVRTGQIKISGKMVDISKYCKSAYQESASVILSKIKSIWRIWELDSILLTGGGSILLNDYLLPELKQAQLVNNPVFGNVNGYRKYGNRVWSK